MTVQIRTCSRTSGGVGSKRSNESVAVRDARKKNGVGLICVHFISIYSLFYMYFCNLNARFTPIFLKITLIPNLLMFCRTRRKIK